MNVLLVTHSVPAYSKGGIESHVEDLSAELAAAGHHVAVLHTVDRGPALQVVKGGRVDHYRVKASYSGMRRYADTYARRDLNAVLERVFEDAAPQLVHVHSLQRLGIAVCEACRRRALPLVFTLHDYWLVCPQGQLMSSAFHTCGCGEPGEACTRCVREQLSLSAWPMRFFDMLFKMSAAAAWKSAALYRVCRSRCGGNGSRADASEQIRLRTAALRGVIDAVGLFLSPSEFTRRAAVERGIPGEKVIVLPHGIRRPAARKAHPGPVRRLGYVGNLSFAKGVHLLIEAFRRLPQADAQLHIYGKSYAAAARLCRYESAARRQAAGDRRIVFHGVFERAELGRVMGMLDGLVVPSLFPETFSLSAAEAVAHGLPVVASRIGALPETVREGIDGLLFEPGDVLDLNRALLRLCDASSAAAVLAAGGDRGSSFKDYAARLMSLYAGVMHSRRERER